MRANFGDHWPLVLKKWKDVCRPWSSLELIARVVDERRASKASEKPSSEQVMDVLEQALQAGDSIEPRRQHGAMAGYYAEQAFTFLDAQGANMARMARLEWGWLQILEHTERGPRVLQSQVTTEPALFVDLLKAVFRAEDEPRDEAVSEDQQRIGQQAFRVLNGIHTVPGYWKTDAGGIVDQATLWKWVTDARKLAEEVKLLRVCDSQIGQILSYAPSSPDGSWPGVEVRDVIEEVQSSRLDNGLRIGRYNQRGVVCRGSGGEQEWELAKQYRALGEQVRAQWPRTAAILDDLAKGYEGEARQWDEEAKRKEYE
jgi:hypothetical protein